MTEKEYMEWNVYHYNINKNKIEKFNIFHHLCFVRDFDMHLKTLSSKEAFAEAIRKELSYYFQHTSEYELIIKLTEDNKVFLYPWCDGCNFEDEKIDVTNETDFDWLTFAKEHINKQIYKNESKIDIYDQVTFQFNEFIDYAWVWDYKKYKIGDINEIKLH